MLEAFLHCSACSRCSSLGHLFCWRKADGILAKIVHRVVPSKEGVAKDDQGSCRCGNIERRETGNTRSLYLEDVVVRSNGEIPAAESPDKVWQAVALLALDLILTVVALLGTNLLIAEGCCQCAVVGFCLEMRLT